MTRLTRHIPHRRSLGLRASGRLPLWLCGIVLALAILTACDQSTKTKKNHVIELGPYTEAHEVDPKSVTTSATGAVDVTATIPDDAQSMGIVVIGTDTNRKFIEHAGLFLDQGDNIRGPDGPVPLSFNTINDSPDPSAINNQAAAVHFPNDGSNLTLPSGKYRFPVGAVNDAACGNGTCPLTTDVLDPIVYYKTATSQKAVLPLNVVVLAGVNPGIASAATAAADPEIEGAIAVFRNVYERKTATDLDVQINVAYSTGCGFDGTPDIIDDKDELFCLTASYPAAPADDAINVYVISSIDFVDAKVAGLDPGIPGPFLLQGLITSGPVAEYQSDGKGTILGYILAHELGHYLGLFHTSQTNTDATAIIGFDPIADTDKCTTKEVLKDGGIDNCPDRFNLMFPYVNDDDDPGFSNGQGNVVRYNPAVTP